jgi:transcriptional regulator NrdR family protein
MKCPECGGKTTVADSTRSDDEVMRKRKCLSCGRFTYTIEYEVEYGENFSKQWNKFHRSAIRKRQLNANK